MSEIQAESTFESGSPKITDIVLKKIQSYKDYVTNRIVNSVFWRNIPKALNDHLPDWDVNKITNVDEYVSFLKILHEDMCIHFTNLIKDHLWIEITLPKLVLYDTSTVETSSHWNVSRLIGPFYGYNDQKIYIHIYDTLRVIRSNGMIWDMSLAYILAHEFGHHIQNQLINNPDPFLDYLIANELLAEDEKNNIKILFSTFIKWKLKWTESIQVTKYMEQWADYLAWTFIQYLNLRGLTHWASDIDEVVKSARAIWDDVRDRRAWKSFQKLYSTHWTWEERAKAVIAWMTQDGFMYSE